MIIGQVLMCTDNSAVKTYYSPWMPSEGNCAVMCCDVIACNLLSACAITVQTKNSDQSDKDAATPYLGSSNSITLTAETMTEFPVGTKISDTTNAGFKELYRYKFVVTGDAGFGTGNGFVHCRMLNPSWLTN